MQEPMLAFIEEALEKDRRGVIEHRGGDDEAEFVGDLLKEYEDEQLDSYNYLRRMFAGGRIKEDEFHRAARLHMECWFWARVNVSMREEAA